VKISTLTGNPIFRFLFKVTGLYIFWFLLYEVWLHPTEKLDIWVIRSTLNLALKIIKVLGYATFSGKDRLLGIDGTNGLWMGDNCDCIELCALFAGFIIAFPSCWRKKLWFIPLGILSIYLLNVLRVVLLALVQKYFSNKWLEFNHTYTFTIVIYLFIFLLWYYWINKLALPKNEK
jgi:exosortase/archaeosortase family protein